MPWHGEAGPLCWLGRDICRRRRRGFHLSGDAQSGRRGWCPQDVDSQDVYVVLRPRDQTLKFPVKILWKGDLLYFVPIYFFLLECLKVFQNFFFLILKVVYTCLMNNIPYIVTCMLCYMFSHCYMYVMLHVFSMLHLCYVTCSLIVTCMLPTY